MQKARFGLSEAVKLQRSELFRAVKEGGRICNTIHAHVGHRYTHARGISYTTTRTREGMCDTIARTQVKYQLCRNA